MLNGVCMAIVAVNLEQEGFSNESYGRSATNALNELSDIGSELYQGFPHLREILKEDIAKAKELYPKPGSVKHLMNILNALQ